MNNKTNKSFEKFVRDKLCPAKAGYLRFEIKELIEQAINEEFEGIDYVSRVDEDLQKVGVMWTAGKYPTEEKLNMDKVGNGKTPTEAINNFWLNLEKQ